MLALVSGRGALPALVAAAVPEKPVVCVLEGFAPDRLEADLTFRLEHLGTLFVDLTARGVTEVCFCGSIERPAFDPAQLDSETLPLVPVMMQAMASGDDGALRAVIGLFESQGFAIRGAHDLAPELLAHEGMLSAKTPDAQMKEDVARAQSILDALSPLDVGQGCVVGKGQVWGIETIGGTDHMIATLPEGAKRSNAVLVKKPKAGQDLRADMPTIGPDTIKALAKAGLGGLVIEAGTVLILNRDETIAAADDAGLVLWSRADV